MTTLVVLESPYAGRGPWPLSFIDRWRNVRYARRCMRDSFLRGEYPIASHLLYTQRGVLRDHLKSERALGIEAGLLWAKGAQYAVVYVDRGVTPGMDIGIARHEREGREVFWRTLGGDPYVPVDALKAYRARASLSSQEAA